MPTPADYIRTLKAQLGDESMSDQALGEVIHAESVRLDIPLKGCGRSTIVLARRNEMGDRLAIVVANMLGEDPTEVVNVARFYRENDDIVKAVLHAGVAKTLAALPLKTARGKRGGMAAMVDQLGGRRKAAAVALSVGLVVGGAPSPAEAAPVPGSSAALCIM